MFFFQALNRWFEYLFEQLHSFVCRMLYCEGKVQVIHLYLLISNRKKNLRGFIITREYTLKYIACDWLENLAPHFRPIEGIAKSDTNTDLVSHTCKWESHCPIYLNFGCVYCDWPGITFVMENLNIRLRNRLEHVEIACIRNFRSSSLLKAPL